MAEKDIDEALVEPDRLGLVFEQLRYLEEQYRTLEHVDAPPDDLKSSLTSAIAELEVLLVNQDLTVNGTMMLPQTDEFGHVIGNIQGDTTLQDCRLVGLVVLQEDISEVFQKGTIALQFAFGERVFQTFTEETTINYRAIVPASLCSINVINEVEDLLSDILPEDDDEIAHEIDISLLNGAIDLYRLARLILREFPNLSEMQREIYLNYIHKIGNINEYEVELSADEYVSYPLGDGEIEPVVLEEPQDLKGVFKGYTVSQVVDDENKQQFLLGVLMQPEGENIVLAIHVQDLTKFHIFT